MPIHESNVEVRAVAAGGVALRMSSTAPTDAEKWVTLKGCRFVEEKYHDGDNFHVEHNGNVYNIRLYFVDAPEIDNSEPKRNKEQQRHFGVTKEQNLKVGQDAKAQVAALLKGRRFEVTTRWQDALGRSQRYYGTVKIGNEDLAEILVRRGLARTKGEDAILPTGETPKERMKLLRGLESEAKKERAGVWKDSTNPESKPSWWRRWAQKVWSFLKELVQ